MGFNDGRIFLNSPNCVYYVGQVLKGRMEFDLDKMETFRGIYANIKGFCYVHWTTKHTRCVDLQDEEYTVYHDAYEQYINEKTYLVGGESGEHHLEPGHHVFPFECLIPATCPSSFKGSHGYVRYEIKVVVDRGFKFDHEKKVAFKVVSPVDLNLYPRYKDPVQLEILNTFCCWCFNMGYCQTLVKLKAAGFCPGQTMPIEVSCKNNSTVNIEAIRFCLKKKIVYHATDEPGDNENTKVMAVIKKGPIPANTMCNWTAEMELPAMDVYNLDSCRFIDIYHIFEVVVETSAFHTDEDQCCGILIGSVPIAGSQDILPRGVQCESNQTVDRQNTQGVESSYPPPTQGAPYPTTAPYPQVPPYPVTTGYPGSNPPDPIANQSFPGDNPVAITPYPTNEGGPYPPTSCPYPTTRPPPYTNPGWKQNVSGTTTPFLKTGALGFGVQPPSNNLTVTESKASYTPNPMNPYVGGSALAPSTSTAGYPGSNPPYPISNQSFPGANPVAITPYPTNEGGPFPPTGCPYPTTPPPPFTNPGLNQNVSGTTTAFLKTGTLGFGVQPPSNNLTVTGSKAPYPTSPVNPYIDASAPQLSTPDDENKSLIGGNKNSAS